jgi:hypothetical protein
MDRARIRRWAWILAAVLFALGILSAIFAPADVGTVLLRGVALGFIPLVIAGLLGFPPGWRKDRPQGYPIDPGHRKR